MTKKKYLFFISQNYSFAILRPLQQAINARGDEVRWFLYGSEINHSFLKPQEIKVTSISAVKKYNPVAVFVPGNTVPSFIPGLKVAVFHGFNSGKLNRKGKEDHFNIRGCFDLYCTQGPNTTFRFQELAEKHLHFLVKETGWPALDPLFKIADKAINTKPTILMCSTFSRNLTCAPILFNKIKELSQAGKWNWLVQFHPKMEKSIVEQYKSIQGEHLTFVETDNIIPLLQKADVMLCDTSSVLIMFLLQGKPVVTFNNIAPNDYLVNISDPEKLEGSLAYALERPDKLLEKINFYIEQTHPNQDGNASERILDMVEYMLNSGRRAKNSKPLNVIRELKLRKALGYWKIS